MKEVALACLLVICGAGCTSEPRQQSAAHDPIRLRILTYNIHHAEGTDRKLDIARIARIISEAKPDLVAIQEVDDRTKRVGGTNEAVAFGKLTGMTAAFAQAMPFQGGGYGQAILSRWPMKTRSIYNLPQLVDREPRITAAVQTRIGETGPEIVFATTHLDHQLEEVRVKQARRLDAILSTNQVPVIVAGDFNAGPESGTMQVLTNNWIDAAAANPQPTIPSGTPRKRIDYILLGKGAHWKVVQTRVLNEPVASDHRPVLAIVELEPPL